MINRKAKYNRNPRLKSCVILSLKPYLCIVCFMLLSLRLLSSLTGTVYADSTIKVGTKLSNGGDSASDNQMNISELELLRANISVAQGESDTKSIEQLRQIIEQIRSVEFKPPRQTPEPLIVPERSPSVEPNETVPDVPNMPVQEEERKHQTRLDVPYEPIADQTLQMLRTLAQEPEKLDNPLDLAEIVFFSGNLKEASTFYSEALKRKDPNDVGSSSDRAWILFQIGNCLRNDDRPAALKAYRQLLTEYPNSPWAEPAKAHCDLIAWYLKDEPDKLMKQISNAPVQQGNYK